MCKLRFQLSQPLLVRHALIHKPRLAQGSLGKSSFVGPDTCGQLRFPTVWNQMDEMVPKYVYMMFQALSSLATVSGKTLPCSVQTLQQIFAALNVDNWVLKSAPHSVSLLVAVFSFYLHSGFWRYVYISFSEESSETSNLLLFTL